jgi:hypothetical protein
MKTCIYCAKDKPDEEFSDEHIWPDALGGDFLPEFWRTDNVCRTCNNASGLYVDGSFIKSWIGNAERATGAREYLSSENLGALPLDYHGRLPDLETEPHQMVEFWTGPCGANIVHIRPADQDEVWSSYAGGDPRVKKVGAGRAYIALTSAEPFWIIAALKSFKSHFRKATRFVVNMEMPPEWLKSFSIPDLNDPVIASDMNIVGQVLEAGKKSADLRAHLVIKQNLGTRLLAKLALAIGYKIFGEPFLATNYASRLREGFREANDDKRRLIPIRGTGFLDSQGLGGAEKTLAWTGGWVLLLTTAGSALTLAVVSPSGRSMSVVVCDDRRLIDGLNGAYDLGQVYLTIPPLGEGVGPISLPEYLAHRIGGQSRAELSQLEAKRHDPALLPACGSNGGS